MNAKIKKVIEEAKWTVDAFDQAETNKAITAIGSRGVILANAIHGLRIALKEAGHPSTLPNEKAPIGTDRYPINP